MINRAVLTGRIAREVELMKSNSGISYIFFTLAVQKRKKDAGADFISCVAWRETAELISQYTKKGDLIGVEGRIEVFSKENGNGGYDTKTQVNVSDITFLNTKSDSERQTQGGFEQSAPAAETQQPEVNLEEIQF